MNINLSYRSDTVLRQKYLKYIHYKLIIINIETSAECLKAVICLRSPDQIHCFFFVKQEGGLCLKHLKLSQ